MGESEIKVRAAKDAVNKWSLLAIQWTLIGSVAGSVVFVVVGLVGHVLLVATLGYPVPARGNFLEDMLSGWGVILAIVAPPVGLYGIAYAVAARLDRRKGEELKRLEEESFIEPAV